MRGNTVIIGAGILGSAVAYELSRRGISGIHVLDPDLEGSLSSSERNAGGVRHLWQQPVNQELSRCSIRLFESIKEDIGFQQSGYLWLFPPERESNGKALLEHTRKHNLEYEGLDVAAIQKRYPFIDKTETLAFGLFGKKDGLLNTNALKNFFRREAKTQGVTFHDLQWVTQVEEKNGQARIVSRRLPSVDAAHEQLKSPTAEIKGEMLEWDAEFAILTAGAWTRELIKDGLIRPLRRQISLFKAENFELSPSHGMIVDTSGVYFHHEGGNILGGKVLKEEPEGYRFEYDADFFESHIWPALYERSTKLERLKPITGWGGLYSYTPDITGILGPVPGKKHLIEAHSFTGHGVMHCYGAAVAVSELLVKGKYETIDCSGMGRARFSEGKMLKEELHI